MMLAKMATLGLLKRRYFKIKNKGYDIIILVHDGTNKIIARDSNCIVHGPCDQVW